ncbi:MAG: hypothetical protein ACK559_13365, partial [bacterium]
MTAAFSCSKRASTASASPAVITVCRLASSWNELGFAKIYAKKDRKSKISQSLCEKPNYHEN